jgi:soluble lytic murein transglycosylase-like protein
VSQPELVILAKQIATAQGLDPGLVCAVIEQESAWDTAAIRLEQGFYTKYVRKQNLPDRQEAAGRAVSWGLMQVMGQVAREHGFTGRLDELCTPEVGIEIGCMVLKTKLKAGGGDLTAGLLKWNGGSRPAYVNEVLARVSKFA